MIAHCLLLTLAVAQEPAASADAIGLDPTPIIGEPADAGLTGEALEVATRDTAQKLRCPTCQGSSVAESPAEGARAMKAEVRKMRARGYSDQQVLDFFEAAYGEFILLEPRKEGANLALWYAPAAIVGVGLLAAAATVLGRRKPPTAPRPETARDPYLDRVDRELDG